MAKAPRKTFRRIPPQEAVPAVVLATHIQVGCPACKNVVGTEGGEAHWTKDLYSRFSGAQCGECGQMLTFPEVIPYSYVDHQEHVHGR